MSKFLQKKNNKSKGLKLTFILVLALAICVLVLAGCGKDEPKAKLRVLEENLGSEEYGIGFRLGDVKLGLAVHDALATMALDTTGEEISTKWFESNILIADAPLLNDDNVRKAEDVSLENVQKAGKLVIGVDSNFPPICYHDEANNLVGFDVDLAKEVCRRLGVTPEFKEVAWADMQTMLANKEVDCIWNGMSITPNRQGLMYIPSAYVKNNQIIIVPEDSAILTIADLTGKNVGLQKGSSSFDALKNNGVFETVLALKEYPDNVMAFSALKAGKIDALVIDELVGLYLISNQ